jgi:hypothetical protein
MGSGPLGLCPVDRLMLAVAVLVLGVAIPLVVEALL